MNTLLFYILIFTIIYFVFFHSSITPNIEKFGIITKSRKECSQNSINHGILDYTLDESKSRRI